MPRNRILKVEFWADAKINRLSAYARLLYMGMWNFADDWGTVDANPLFLHANIFPKDKEITTEKVANFLSEIEKEGMIKKFVADENEYYYIIHFLEHQNISKKSERVNPAPPESIIKECSNNVTVILQSHPHNNTTTIQKCYDNVPNSNINKNKNNNKNNGQYGKKISIQAPCVVLAREFIPKIDKTFNSKDFENNYFDGDKLKILQIIQGLLKELDVNTVRRGFEQLARDGTNSVNDALNLGYNGHGITFKFRKLASAGESERVVL